MKIRGRNYTAAQLAKAKKYIIALVIDEFNSDKPFGTDEWPYELPRAMGLKCDDDGDYGFWYEDCAAIVKAVFK